MHRGRKYWIVFVLFLIAAEIKAKPNDTLTTAQVESVSLKLFNDKNWKELIRYSDMVIDNGFDYYFIRMRAGIANYETKKYRKAELHFKKALLYNEGDEDATSYLYYCLIFDEKYEEARWLSKSFSEALAKKLKTNVAPSVSYINFEGALKLSNEHDSIGDTKYFQIGLSHYVKNRASIYHSFSFNSQEDKSNSITRGKLPPRGNMPGGTEHPAELRDYDVAKLRQYHYYLKTNIPLKHSMLLTLSGQLIYSNTMHTIYDTVYHLDSINPPPPDLHIQSPPNDGGLGFVISTSLKKSTTHLDYSIGALADLNKGNNEYQFSAALEYHPFANNFFNIGCIGYLHWAQSFGATNSISYSPYLSFVPLKKLSITADYLHNTKGNVVEYAGYYVNNTPFFIKDKFSLGANYHFNNKLGVYINYGLENRGSRYSDFTFTNNLFLIGIAITP